MKIKETKKVPKITPFGHRHQLQIWEHQAVYQWRKFATRRAESSLASPWSYRLKILQIPTTLEK